MTKSEEFIFKKLLTGQIVDLRLHDKQISSIRKKLSLQDIRESLKLVPNLLMKDEQLSLIFKKIFKTKFYETILYQALQHIFIMRSAMFHETEPEMIKSRFCYKMLFGNNDLIWTKKKIEASDFFNKEGLIAIMGSMGLGKTTYILEFLEIYFSKIGRLRPVMTIELKNGLMYEFKDDFKKLLVKSCIDAIKLFNFPMKEIENVLKSEIVISLYNNPIFIIDGIDEYRGDPHILEFLLSNLRNFGTVFIFGREERIKNLIEKNLSKTYDFYDELYKLSYLTSPKDNSKKKKVDDELERNQVLEYMNNFAEWKKLSVSDLPTIENLTFWAPDHQSHKLSYRNPLILKILLQNTSTLDSKVKITQYGILEKLGYSTFEWFINKFRSGSILSEVDFVSIEGVKLQVLSLIESFFKIYSKIAIKSRFKKWEKHRIWIPNENNMVIDEKTITTILDKLTRNGEIREELYIFYFFDFLTSSSGFLQFAGENNYQIIPERMIDFFILYEIKSLMDFIENPRIEYKLRKLIGSIIGNTEDNSNLVYQFIQEMKSNSKLENLCSTVEYSNDDLKQIILLKNLEISWRDINKVLTFRGKIIFLDFKSVDMNRFIKLIDNFDSLRYLEFKNKKLEKFPESIINFRSIIYLTLLNNHIQEIPHWIYKYESLEYLNLRYNKIKILPNAICYLFNLKKLLLAHNEITKIPTSVKFLLSLEHLDLSDNKLKSIPKSIGKLKSLKFLFIGKNSLLSIPSTIGALKSLEILYLKGNRLKTLPDTLLALKKLKKINLADNNIKDFNLKNLKSLKEVNLSSNELIAFPEGITTLESLEILNLENNKLKTLPESIDKLKYLKRLNLANNKLNSIPCSILNLSLLTEIIFRDNPFYEEIYSGSNAILKQLEDKKIVYYLDDESKYFCSENLIRYKYEFGHRATDVSLLKKRGIPILLRPIDLLKLLNIDFPTLIKYTKANKNAPSSEYNYRKFRIKKKSKGYREILAPKPQLKALQQDIYEKILKKISPSEFSHGFRIDHSIVSNAKMHLNAKFVYTIDIKNFFTSIKFDKVISFYKSIGYSGVISFLLASLCTAPPRQYSRKTKTWVLSKKPLSFLPQGAPTSPALSNLVCNNLDSKISFLALKYEYRYTRYADDFTFSCEKSEKLDHKFRSQIFDCIKNYGFDINLKKERYSRNYKPLKVTGIIINEDCISLPRKWIRNLRAALFQFKALMKSGDIEEISLMQRKIEGYCSYATMVNREKYQKFLDDFTKIKNSSLNTLNE